MLKRGNRKTINTSEEEEGDELEAEKEKSDDEPLSRVKERENAKKIRGVPVGKRKSTTEVEGGAEPAKVAQKDTEVQEGRKGERSMTIRYGTDENGRSDVVIRYFEPEGDDDDESDEETAVDDVEVESEQGDPDDPDYMEYLEHRFDGYEQIPVDADSDAEDDDDRGPPYTEEELAAQERENAEVHQMIVEHEVECLARSGMIEKVMAAQQQLLAGLAVSAEFQKVIDTMNPEALAAAISQLPQPEVLDAAVSSNAQLLTEFQQVHSEVRAEYQDVLDVLAEATDDAPSTPAVGMQLRGGKQLRLPEKSPVMSQPATPSPKKPHCGPSPSFLDDADAAVAHESAGRKELRGAEIAASAAAICSELVEELRREGGRRIEPALLKYMRAEPPEDFMRRRRGPGYVAPRFVCPQCGLKFSRETFFNVHMGVHARRAEADEIKEQTKVWLRAKQRMKARNAAAAKKQQQARAADGEQEEGSEEEQPGPSHSDTSKRNRKRGRQPAAAASDDPGAKPVLPEISAAPPRKRKWEHWDTMQHSKWTSERLTAPDGPLHWDGPCLKSQFDAEQYQLKFGDECRPSHIFEEFWSDDVLKTMVECIRDYTKARQAKGEHLYSFKSIGGVDNLTVEHMRAWLGVLLASGKMKTENREDYWKMGCTYNQSIADCIRKELFLSICYNLHFVDSSVKVADTSERICKVAPFLETMMHNFSRWAPIAKDFVIDESMVPYFGVSPIKVRMVAKPIRYGYVMYCICVAEGPYAGYCVSMLIWTGDDACCPVSCDRNKPRDFAQGKFASIVWRLLAQLEAAGLLYKGCHIYADNAFVSFNMMEDLMEEGIAMTGTLGKGKLPNDLQKVLPNWPEQPSGILVEEGGEPVVKKRKQTKAQIRAGEPAGQTVEPQRGAMDLTVDPKTGIKLTSWFDNKLVRMVSTVLGTKVIQSGKELSPETCERWSGHTKSRVAITCPACIKDYNRKKGWVDILDRKVADERTSVNMYKDYWPIAVWCLDVAVCNAWFIWRRLSKVAALSPKRTTLGQFRKLLADEYLQRFSMPVKPTGIMKATQVKTERKESVSIALTRLDKTLRHFPVPYDMADPKKRVFCACCDRQHRDGAMCRTHTYLRCEDCKVALCVGNCAVDDCLGAGIGCWKAWHSEALNSEVFKTAKKKKRSKAGTSTAANSEDDNDEGADNVAADDCDN